MPRGFIWLVSTILALAGPAAVAGRQAGFDAFCRSAMAPYYAALLSSARGDADGTLRHLLVLQSRWDTLSRVPAADVPVWAGAPGDPRGVVAAVTGQIQSTRKHIAARDIAGAHAELEAIRVLLRDARARHHLRTFDDALADYHEAMERVTSHVGLRNEIVFGPEDYELVDRQVARASASWKDAAGFEGATAGVSGWQAIARQTDTALASLQAAASARDADAVHKAAGTLKARYFELLALLGRG